MVIQEIIVVLRSSTKAKYRSLAHAISEVTWIQSLLGEHHIKLSSYQYCGVIIKKQAECSS